MDNYKPVISECKMILSKKVVQRNSHQPCAKEEEEVGLEGRYEGERRSRKGQGSKENVVWPKRNKS